jgi:hypothetical protein
VFHTGAQRMSGHPRSSPVVCAGVSSDKRESLGAYCVSLARAARRIQRRSVPHRSGRMRWCGR